MSNIQSDILCVKEFLKSQHINVLDEWLEGCVTFFREQRRYTQRELNEKAKEQWLLSDLTVTCGGCLPSNLSQCIKTQLTGIYALQINHVLDIALPAYQQLQKLSKVDTTNIEVTLSSYQSQYPEPPTNHSQRMLKLIMTDGVQEINGMEYKPMRNISSDLTPGTKLLLKGPVDCRRGMLLLEEKHITILGGEVEDLVNENNYANILLKIVERNNRRGPSISSNSQFTRESVQINRNSIQAFVPPTSFNEREADNFNANMFNDDFDMEALDRIEQSALNPPATQPPTPKPVVKKMRLEDQGFSKEANWRPFNDICEMDNIMPDEDEQYLEMIQNEDFNFTEEPQHENTETVNLPVKVTRQPFIYIKQLVECPDTEKLNKEFLVKAQVISIINKLKFKNGDWELKCKICDGTSYLDVDVSSDVLSLLVGYTPSEMSRLKHQMAVSLQLKGKVVQGLSEAHRKLQIFDLLMNILYKSSGPCITKIIDFTEEHLWLLKERVYNIPINL